MEAISEWFKKRIRSKSGHRLLSVKQAIQSGTSRERREVIAWALSEELYQIMDESFVEALRGLHASDHDPEVRKSLTILLGSAQRFHTPPAAARVVDLLLRLSADENPEIRFYAVNGGLSESTSLPERREAVIRRLVTLALADQKSELGDLVNKISIGLRSEPQEAIEGPG